MVEDGPGVALAVFDAADGTASRFKVEVCARGRFQSAPLPFIASLPYGNESSTRNL